MRESKTNQRRHLCEEIKVQVVNFAVQNFDRDIELERYKDLIWDLFSTAFSQDLCTPQLKANGLSRPRKMPGPILCYDTFIQAIREIQATLGEEYDQQIGDTLATVAEWWYQWTFACSKPEVQFKKKRGSRSASRLNQS